jgi:hypothetical protein
MRYLILIYGNPESRAIWESFTDDERAEGFAYYGRLTEELAASGEGFYLLECESVDRAVEIAGRIPEAEMGLVEVRPVMDLGGTEM